MPPSAAPSGTLAELRRRISYLMLFRLALITLVLGTTVALNLASPQQLAKTHSLWLFGIVGCTYVLTLGYAITLPRVRDPARAADVQVALDLVVTTVLVHVTGGAQSGFTFFYFVSILGAAIVRYRKGAVAASVASIVLLTSVCLLGWLRWLPVPPGQRIVPWDIGGWQLLRQMALHGGAFLAVAFLAAHLGQQLASAGERLQSARERTADLAALHTDVIRCLSSGLLTIDAEGRVTSCNRVAEEILGLRYAEAIRRPLAEVVPEVARVVAESSERAVVRRAEVTARRPRGELVLGVSITPLTDRHQQLIGRILNFQDLTELRRMESQVKRAERLAVIGGLAAGIAHEIRNPLASISGSIELLKRAPQASGENQTLMEIVVREVDRLNEMLTEFLEYARPRPPAPVPVELGEVLDETVRVFAQDKSAAGVTVALARGAPEVRIAADPSQLRQVVWNLLRNAAEAMPDGGEVAVRVDVEDGQARLTVRDHGVGIAHEDQERIFEPFFTTKARGSGLGLPTVHRIVAEHGGTVGLTSVVGEGTTFTVRLPLLTSSPASAS